MPFAPVTADSERLMPAAHNHTPVWLGAPFDALSHLAGTGAERTARELRIGGRTEYADIERAGIERRGKRRKERTAEVITEEFLTEVYVRSADRRGLGPGNRMLGVDGPELAAPLRGVSRRGRG